MTETLDKTNETPNLQVTNISVYGIDQTRLASGFPMMAEYNSMDFFNDLNDYGKQMKADARLQRLAACKGGESHDCALVGIVAQFNLTAPRYFWQEWQRYHFQDIVSSMSTMHRLQNFCQKGIDLYQGIKDDETNRKYIDFVYQHFTAETDLEMIDLFLKIVGEKFIINLANGSTDPKTKTFIKSNLPEGFIITARITTNYRQLKTIYHQRRYHELAEWRTFCNYYLKLFPHNDLFIIGD